MSASPPPTLFVLPWGTRTSTTPRLRRSPQVPEYLKRDCLLFYYPDCEQLARRIMECSHGRVELAEIQWKCARMGAACMGAACMGAACMGAACMGTCMDGRGPPGVWGRGRGGQGRWRGRLRGGAHPAAPALRHRRFADGFPNLFVKDAIKIRNRHVAFLASFHTPGAPSAARSSARPPSSSPAPALRCLGARAHPRSAPPPCHAGVIFEQISIIYQLPRLFVGSFTLVLPYFPTGTGAPSPGLTFVLGRRPRPPRPPRPRPLLPPLPAPLARAAERVEAEGDVATAFTLARIISNIPLARGGPASVVIFDIHALQARTRSRRAAQGGAALAPEG